MRALLYCRNLMGDGLQSGPAIRSFYEAYKSPEADFTGRNAGCDLTLCVHDDYSRIIYDRLDIPVKIITLSESEIDETQFEFVFRMDISRAWKVAMPTGKSCAAAFAIMLGVTIPNSIPYYDVPKAALDVTPEGLILFQPYSRSCSSHTNEPPNKRWVPDSNWGKLYEAVKSNFPDKEVRVIGGKSDLYIPGIPEVDHWLGKDLDTVAAAQRKATLVVTIDSGPAHLAASQLAETLEFYPKCLPVAWMGKIQNPNWQCIHATPASLSFDYVWQCVQKRLFNLLETEVHSISY